MGFYARLINCESKESFLVFPELQIEKGQDREGVIRRAKRFTQSGYFVCPGCYEEAGGVTEENKPFLEQVLRAGAVNRVHFAHTGKKKKCTPKSNLETDLHIAAKVALFESLKSSEFVSEAFLERRLGKRKPDVFAKFADGSLHAYEVQISSQSEAKFLNRSLDLRNAGAATVTWLIERNHSRKDFLLKLSLKFPWVKVQFLEFTVIEKTAHGNFYHSTWFDPTFEEWESARAEREFDLIVSEKVASNKTGSQEKFCEFYLGQLQKALEVAKAEEESRIEAERKAAFAKEVERRKGLEPYKGNLSDLTKLSKWILKHPLLPVPPFVLMGQPWITVTGDRFFEVLRRDCQKYLKGEKVFGEARFAGELRSMAMMSQELAKEVTEEIDIAA